MRICFGTIFYLIFLRLAAANAEVTSESQAETINVYWYPLSGVLTSEQQKFEYHVVKSFEKYINKKYDNKIGFNWIKAGSYEGVLKAVEDDSIGAFGAANFSITDERKKRVDFLRPHFPDIMVLVSNVNIPVAQTSEDFKANFSNQKNAITIKGTTFEKSIRRLEDSIGITFNNKYVKNGIEMVETISEDSLGFGYVPLTLLLKFMNKKEGIRRQFFHTVKLDGLALIQTKNSKWKTYTNDYFNGAEFQDDMDSLIRQYYGKAAFNAIKSISQSLEIGPYEEIIIANREREIQYRQLLEAAENERIGYVVITLLIIVAISAILFLIYSTNEHMLQVKTTKSLQEKQQIIERQNEQLQDLDKRKNELIRVLAHDLRTPIFQIKSILEVVDLENLTAEKRTELFEHLDLSCEKMSNMITRILNTEAIEKGQLNLNIEEFDLSRLIQELVKQLTILAEKREVKLSIDVEPDLTVKADKDFLNQIINGLLDNGMVFGGKDSEVSIQARAQEDYIQITIKDEGPGIATKESLEFFENKSSKMGDKQNSMEAISYGLSIIKKHTELMNGKFSFISNSGNGTSFFILLPKA